MGGLKRDPDTYVFKDELKGLIPKFHDAPPNRNVIKREEDIERLAFGKKKPFKKPKLD